MQAGASTKGVLHLLGLSGQIVCSVILEIRIGRKPPKDVSGGSRSFGSVINPSALTRCGVRDVAMVSYFETYPNWPTILRGVSCHCFKTEYIPLGAGKLKHFKGSLVPHSMLARVVPRKRTGAPYSCWRAPFWPSFGSNLRA